MTPETERIPDKKERQAVHDAMWHIISGNYSDWELQLLDDFWSNP